MPMLESNIRKGANHVSSLGVLCLYDLVCYYFQLRVVNLGKMKKDELLDIINSHLQQLTDSVDHNKANNIDENVVARAIDLLSWDEDLAVIDDPYEGEYDFV